MKLKNISLLTLSALFILPVNIAYAASGNSNVVSSTTSVSNANQSGEAVIGSYFNARSVAANTGNTNTLDKLISNAPGKEQQAEHLRYAALRRVFKQDGAQVTSINETYNIISMTTSGSQAQATVAVTDQIYWKVNNSSTMSAITTEHHIILNQVNGTWVIQSDQYDEGPMGVNSSNPGQTMKDLNAQNKPTIHYKQGKINHSSKSSVISPNGLGVTNVYNGSTGAAYADQYVYHSAAGSIYSSYYNPYYLNFNSSGGDCANYASQAAYNAGAYMVNMDNTGQEPTTNAWWYDHHGTTTTADDTASENWTYSPWLYDFMLSSQGYGSSETSASSMTLGAMEFIKWHSTDSVIDHTTYVVGYNGTIPLLDSHNNDYYHVPWNYGYSDSVYYFVNLANYVAN